jgi:hypothetical protein
MRWYFCFSNVLTSEGGTEASIPITINIYGYLLENKKGLE